MKSKPAEMVSLPRVWKGSVNGVLLFRTVEELGTPSDDRACLSWIPGWTWQSILKAALFYGPN